MTAIPIEYEAEDDKIVTTLASFYVRKIDELKRENDVLKTNFAQAMTLYNKSEAELKALKEG